MVLTFELYSEFHCSPILIVYSAAVCCAEFQRLALGFKCDMFTLEKRLRLEERSRDLAEENVRREVSIALKCLELFTRSDENACSNTRIFLFVSILFLTLTKTATLSGRQENRIGKAVEVMIQHVENLRRTYTKEHAELLELREAHMQSERSFVVRSFCYWRFYSSPRLHGVLLLGGLFLLCPYVITMVSRNVPGKSMARPPLKRFVSSAAWVDTEDPPDMTKGLTSHFVLPAGLLALLFSLVTQPAVDAAPVGTGDSWMTIQQLLWPYTGLRHNGQPPV
uniref:Lymphoid-restricted membrane protein n=1 Tax=Poecilia reticulata TaxID=8081 RepID=A0A3P9PC14_POERE